MHSKPRKRINYIQQQSGKPWTRQRITVVFVLLMLFLFPLAMGGGGYANLSAVKYALFASLSLAYLAALLFLRFWHPVPAGQLAGPVVAVLPQLLLCALFVLAVLSSMLSPYGWLTIAGSNGKDGLLVLALLLFTTLCVARYAQWKDGFLSAVLGASLMMNLLALLQLAGWNPLGLYPAGSTYYDGGQLYVGQFLSTIGNVDMLAACYCLFVPLLVLALYRCGGWRRWLAGLALASTLAVLVGMRTEGCLLGLLAASVLCLPLLLRRRCWRWLAYALLLLAGLVLLIWIYHYNGAEQGTLWELSRILHGDVRDSFGSARIQIWRAAWQEIEQRPWLGSGCGTERLRFDIVYSRLVESTGYTLTARVTRAHNEYLGYALELGIPAALLYLAALLSSIWQGLRCWLRQRNVIALALSASLLAYAVQALFNYRSIVVAPLLWLLWGLLLQISQKGAWTNAND